MIKTTLRMELLFVLLIFPHSSCNNNLNSDFDGDINLPPGFKIETYAGNVGNARSMALSENGILFVGTRQTGGNVYAVLDTNKDFIAD